MPNRPHRSPFGESVRCDTRTEAQIKSAAQRKKRIAKERARALDALKDSLTDAQIKSAARRKKLKGAKNKDVQVAARHAVKPCVIYVAQGEDSVWIEYRHLGLVKDPIKIGGASKDVRKHVGGLWTGNPFRPGVVAEVNANPSLELFLHDAFRSRSLFPNGGAGKGWFAVTPEEVVDLIRKEFPDPPVRLRAPIRKSTHRPESTPGR